MTQSKDTNSQSITDEELDNLIHLAESTPANLTFDQAMEIERWLNNTRITRRLTLMTLTKPFIDLQESIKNDRKTAEAFADLAKCQENLIEGFENLLGLAKQSNAWLLVALTTRADYEEIMKAAESGEFSGDNSDLYQSNTDQPIKPPVWTRPPASHTKGAVLNIKTAEKLITELKGWANTLPRDIGLPLWDALDDLNNLLIRGWTEVDEALLHISLGTSYLHRWQGRNGRIGNVDLPGKETK